MRSRCIIWVITWSVAVTVRAIAADTLTPQKLPLGSQNVPTLETNPGKAPVPVGTSIVANSSAKSDVANSAQDEINQRVDKAYTWINRGHMQDAIRMFNDVLAKDPVNKRARFGLGSAYIELQLYKDALAVLEPMVKEFPGDYFLKNNIAWLYATAKDFSIRNGAKAVQFAQDALLIAPKDFHVWSTLSEGYYISGQYDKALRAAEEALKLSLESPTGADSAEEYRRQVEKNRKASQAMSILQ